jgi:hypothetical protein
LKKNVWAKLNKFPFVTPPLKEILKGRRDKHGQSEKRQQPVCAEPHWN